MLEKRNPKCTVQNPEKNPDENFGKKPDHYYFRKSSTKLTKQIVENYCDIPREIRKTILNNLWRNS